MFVNSNTLMELHKTKESELLRKAESSRSPRLADANRRQLTERFVHAFTGTFGFWGLR